MDYFLPVLFFIILAAVAGGVLAYASHAFAVKINEKVAAIRAALPGSNCGGCGFSGCDGYAAALVETEPAPACNLCKPGGANTAAKIAEILGTNAGDTAREVARVACFGAACPKGADANVYNAAKFNYGGIQSCAANARFYAGESVCEYGCLGYGDCAAVCPENAINIVEREGEKFATIDPTRCIACGMCVKTCPKRLISVRKEDTAYVRCSNCDIGKKTRSVCANGCIGCGICVKKCQYDAVVVENNISRIDASKCVNCGECAKACPVKCIV